MPARRFGGIRARVTLLTVVVCLVAMAVVVGVAAYASQMSVREIIGHSMLESLDAAQEEAEAGDVAGAVDHSGINLLQAVDADGRVIASTPNAQGLQAISGEGDIYEVDDLELDGLPEAPGEDAADEPRADDDTPATRFVAASHILATPGPFLVMRRTVDTPEGPVTLVALTSVHLALEIAEESARALAALLLALLVFIGVFAWMMTGRMLQPVERMRRDAESVSVHELSRRITPPEGDRDLSALADTFNGLLSRIEASVEEQKRFLSDASHELKSPIAATSLMLEALRRDPASAGDPAVLADLEAENSRLAGIVGDLLMLARYDENRLAAEPAPIDYCDLLYEEAASLRQRCTHTIDDSGVRPVIGQADCQLLGHAIRNLLDNAARYARSTVWLSCREDSGAVVIHVSDDGPGIPEPDRERVFGRFVRLEASRSRERGSTGLGLAVVRGIVEQHRGRVFFDAPDHGGATAVVELPLRGGAVPEAPPEPA